MSPEPERAAGIYPRADSKPGGSRSRLGEMKTGRGCPKCQGNRIARIEGRTGAYGAGNNITMGFTTFSSVGVTRYLCGGCGYSEEWIDDPEDLRKVYAKYGPAE